MSASTPLTILATPKPFCGHIGVIQHNAITSWTKLRPRPEIFLFGEEQGVAEIAAELQIGHLRDIARNEFGTPLLDDLLRRARSIARTPLLCFANSDIILMPEFPASVAVVAEQFQRFLLVAHRLNIDVGELIGFGPAWESAFRRDVLSRGKLGEHSAIDVFVFPRDLYSDVPPLVIGRAWIDQWLIRAAREQGVPVVDVTPVARAIHQNHEYSHVQGGQKSAYWGEEALRNLEFCGRVPHAFTLLDATHELRPGGRLVRVRFRRQKHVARHWLWKNVVERTASLRARFGLRRETLRRLLRKDSAAKA